MIPQKLTLKNFLSYRDATLDFRGLHTACICGANGAGKSSLLEAIAWAIWGQSRAVSEDDVIHLGAEEVLVDFLFINNHQLYRVLRSRQRGQATVLEFQVAQSGGKGWGDAGINHWRVAELRPESEERDYLRSPVRSDHKSPTSVSFRSLTAKGVRATQQVILEHLKLDYDTFINSAYLRQGRADEFMLKRPSERKEILTTLLKLDQYEQLAERAKDQARQLKGQSELLEQSLQVMQAQLQQREEIAQERTSLETTLADLQRQQESDRNQLQTFQTMQQQRQIWQQQMLWQQQQQQSLSQDCQRLQQECLSTQQQQQELENLLYQEDAIAVGYAQFQALQTQEEQLSATFHPYQAIQLQRQQYQQQQAEQIADLNRQLQQTQAQHEALVQQNAELQQTLNKATDVEAAMQQLQQARRCLSQLDQLQMKASPLLQRRQQIQRDLDRGSTRLNARLEELQTSLRHLQQQQNRQPYLQQAVLEIRDQIERFEQRRLYQQQVREKGLERRSFMERLQADQRNCQVQLAEVQHKIQLLQSDRMAAQQLRIEPDAGEMDGDSLVSSLTHYLKQAEVIEYPPCPLCDRPLDERHWRLVLEKHQAEQQAILEQLWIIREQLAVSEREIQVLRQEYRELEQELGQYGAALEKRGQLQEQLQVTLGIQTTIQQVQTDVLELEHCLQTRNDATDLQDELAQIDRSLQTLQYDEKNHALARGEVDRWRWAEIRQAEIKQAHRRRSAIAQRQLELQAAIADLQQHLTQLELETSQGLAALDQQSVAIGYDPEQHNAIRLALRQAQPWQLRYQEFCRAQQTYPLLRQRLEEQLQMVQERQQALYGLQAERDAIGQQLEQTPDCQSQIHQLEQQIQQRRSHLDQQLAHLGRLQQQQQQLATLSTQHATLSTQLQITQRQQRIYQELAQAFGKNGIQALMIENVLPQLEVETNQILSRLSANQLHVQFVTQRSSRRDQLRNAKLKPQPAKLIDTLDILIADAHGTRSYETYSGGEAFRVNFSIRLALARLLAQRSGMALQLLIVDEGFGTQDAEGCDRLIAAINAIAPDFACILTITHVPHFKEAFQSRIEVVKTEHGSQLRVSL
jgi:exonuclease SbcC